MSGAVHSAYVAARDTHSASRFPMYFSGEESMPHLKTPEGAPLCAQYYYIFYTSHRLCAIATGVDSKLCIGGIQKCENYLEFGMNPTICAGGVISSLIVPWFGVATGTTFTAGGTALPALNLA